MTLKEQILAYRPTLTKVDAFGATLYVRVMSGKDRDAFEVSLVDDKTRLQNIRARLVARTVCDEDGNRIFTDEEAESLGDTAGDELDKVFAVAQKINGIGQRDVEELQKK